MRRAVALQLAACALAALVPLATFAARAEPRADHHRARGRRRHLARRPSRAAR